MTKATRTRQKVQAATDKVGTECLSLSTDVRSGTAKELYAEILSRTESPRKNRSLANVWDALEHLRIIKSQDFSIASVARAIDLLKHSGPRAQSIRNAEGRDFRELIKAYEKEFGPKKSDNPDELIPDHIVGSISDLRTAALVRQLLAEKKALERRNDLLKHQFARLLPVNLEEPVASDVDATARVLTSAPPPLREFETFEISAVVSFIENVAKHSQDTKLRFDHSGALLWRDGDLELARPGFLQVLFRISGKEMEGSGVRSGKGD